MPLVEQLTELAEELEGPGIAEATVVGEYIRDVLVPLFEDDDAEMDADKAVESLQEINEWVQWTINRIQRERTVKSA
ncbi:hypothetical protein [Alicyclobacillus sp. ALC3]|uniref:hypothetical protein n=1 Tax=Alicyclobacillus sp. ALC3 TaxID=2796143 RepID=UPI002379E773|nr:hypothetical protein [Alicyclobacillus sp. ALC3]WDL98157.1 hypothetical protein JC200_05500 [Alicyclobacillus sp. ALC3]